MSQASVLTTAQKKALILQSMEQARKLGQVIDELGNTTQTIMDVIPTFEDEATAISLGFSDLAAYNAYRDVLNTFWADLFQAQATVTRNVLRLISTAKP